MLLTGVMVTPRANADGPPLYTLAIMRFRNCVIPLAVVTSVVAGLGCGENKTVIEKSTSEKTVYKTSPGGGKTTTVLTQAGGGGAGGGGGSGLNYTGASSGFARAVRDEYLRRGGGDITVTAYSQAKGRSYDIVCVGGTRVVCQGGTTENAYITFPGSASGGGGGSLRYTGASAGFAEAVRDEYVRRGGGDITVTAYSEAKGRSYDIVCTGGARVVCEGGTTENAYITFDR